MESKLIRPLRLRVNADQSGSSAVNHTSEAVGEFLGQPNLSPSDKLEAGVSIVSAVAKHFNEQTPNDKLKLYQELESAIGQIVMDAPKKELDT
jgi:hypothetical protein